MLSRLFAVVCLILLPAAAAFAQSEPPPAPGATGAPIELAPPPPAAPTPPPIPAAPPSSEQPGGLQPGGAQPGGEPQQAGAQQQPSRTFCEQNVAFPPPDPTAAPEQYRQFVGVWSDAAWDARTCAALVVQDVKPDGAASIIYVYGPEASDATEPAAVLHGTGVIRGGELRFQNSDGSQYAFRPGIVDMTGHWVNPKGESFQAIFKQTP
ncbi:MAG: hypothetical protein WA184_13775 [Stellaceae bacterium]